MADSKDESLPSASGVPASWHRLGIVARIWRGDPTLLELPLDRRMLLLELHFLASDRGTWPYVPADSATLAAMLGMNPRPVDRYIESLRQDGFVLVVPDDLTRLRLRRIDALVAVDT